MKEHWKTVWSRAAPVAKSALRRFGLYFDDLLLLGAGVCFVLAAREAFGRPAALTVAGIWMAAYAALIVRARKGGGR